MFEIESEGRPAALPATIPSHVPALVQAAGERAQTRFCEFFIANIRNPHTRRGYGRAIGEFLAWCEQRGLASLIDIAPLHIGAYVEALTRSHSAPTAKQRLAAIIDSQSVKTTEAGGPRGFDAGKKIKGRKRHIVTDTQGHMLTGIVHEASIQDRDGAPRVIGFACESFPTITHIFADSGYAGEKLEAALAGEDEWPRHRNRQTPRCHKGLRPRCTALGRRTNPRLA